MIDGVENKEWECPECPAMKKSSVCQQKLWNLSRNHTHTALSQLYLIVWLGLQEMVDGMEDKKWECPEFTAMKIERRRLAGERARQKRASQSKLARHVHSDTMLFNSLHCFGCHWQAFMNVQCHCQILAKLSLATRQPKFVSVSHRHNSSCTCNVLRSPSWKPFCIAQIHHARGSLLPHSMQTGCFTDSFSGFSLIKTLHRCNTCFCCSAPSGSDAGLDNQSLGAGREIKKSRRPKAAPKSKKRKAADEAAGTVGEAEEEELEPVELYCTCRQPDDGLRQFIQCNTCDDWFHTDCVGVDLQVGVTAVPFDSVC